MKRSFFKQEGSDIFSSSYGYYRLRLFASHIFMQTPEVEFSFKAAIVDQIGGTYPSSPEIAREFNETITNLLENAGFNVSYHKRESITVNFYKGLAKYNYGIIILRTHSALREDKPIVENKYPAELVTAGFYEWEENVFYCAITPEFIRTIDGVFPKSIVIAMGCNSLNKTCAEMADAFIRKGAKAYIGWIGPVSISHSDNSTLKFLQLLINNMTIRDAIDECNKIRDLDWPLVKLSYYPSEIGDSKLLDLTTKAALNTFSQLHKHLFIEREDFCTLKIAT